MSIDSVDELISGHFDQALQASERAALDRLLCTDAQVARRFATYARLHANLRSHAQDAAAVCPPDFDSPVPRAPRRAAPDTRRGRAGQPIRWPAALGLAALIAIAVVGGWWLAQGERGTFAQVDVARGVVMLNGETGGDGRMANGDRITTGSEASATLRLADGSSILLDADTDVVLLRRERAWDLQLERGEVECTVVPQAADGGFVLRTPEASVAVVGTRFRVEHLDGRSTVRVSEGAVTVAAGGELLRLGPTDRAIVSRGVISTDHPRTVDLDRAAPLWHRDFEQPIESALWLSGQRVPTADLPPGNRSQACIQATVFEHSNGSKLLKVAIKSSAAPLFTAEENLVIRLRYWTNREAGWLGIWMATEPWEAYTHYHREFTPITDRWVTTTIQLKDILNDTTNQPPAPGDRVVHLMFQCEAREGAKLYIDDISVERQ